MEMLMLENTMPHSALSVSNYFIDLARGDDSLTPMKLQKILYYAHGWCLALSDEPLIKERIEAWKYGPVIPVVYQEFKQYGNGSIKVHAQIFDMDTPTFELVTPRIANDSPIFPFLNRIWATYGKYSAVQLSNATHIPGTPWYITWEENGGKNRPGTDIPDELIKEHFKALIPAKA